MMSKEMEKIDIPPVREFVEMIHDAGGDLYACKATVDMFHLKKEDFCEQMDEIITVGDFYEKSAGAQIIFT
jgi:peroxiredoxin family protein